MIFKVYNSTSTMIAGYSIVHSNYQKIFDAKVKSLHNSYTTDIHINKEQFGVLSVKFIITASDLVKLHKIYTFQSNPTNRIAFLDPETDFEYNIHCTSPFQQNRLGLKDVVSYFEFNLTADIIGLGAFPTYKTGDASFWTQWSEKWQVGPVANATAMKAHPYYSNKFDMSGISNVGTKLCSIAEDTNYTGHGDGSLFLQKNGGTQYFTYQTATLKDYGTKTISLLNIRNLTPSLRHRISFKINFGNYVSQNKSIEILYIWEPAKCWYDIRVWDGAIGSAPIKSISYSSTEQSNQNPVDLWIKHSPGIVRWKLFGWDWIYSGTEYNYYNYVSGDPLDKISQITIKTENVDSGTTQVKIGAITFEEDYNRKVTIP